MHHFRFGPILRTNALDQRRDRPGFGPVRTSGGSARTRICQEDDRRNLYLAGARARVSPSGNLSTKLRSTCTKSIAHEEAVARFDRQVDGMAVWGTLIDTPFRAPRVRFPARNARGQQSEKCVAAGYAWPG